MTPITEDFAPEVVAEGAPGKPILLGGVATSQPRASGATRRE
jgi:hypothetical protein